MYKEHTNDITNSTNKVKHFSYLDMPGDGGVPNVVVIVLQMVMVLHIVGCAAVAHDGGAAAHGGVAIAAKGSDVAADTVVVMLLLLPLKLVDVAAAAEVS